MSTATGRGYLLSTTEFDVCRELLGIEEFPVALDLPSPGTTRDGRQRLIEKSVAALRDRGLADAVGLDPDLAANLRLLARPRWMVDGRFWHPDGSLRALGAADGGHGVVATVDGAHVGVRPTTEYRVVAEITSLAGQTPAGNGESISVPADVFATAARAAGADTRALVDRLIARQVPPRDARALATMCRDAQSRGQFGAEAAPGGGGARRRARRVVAFHDTPAGRYLQLRKPGQGGTWWSTVTPCSPAQLTTQVTELVDEITERGRRWP